MFDPDRASEHGFTLIEALVALMVCAMLLTIIMPAAITAKARRDAGQAREAAVPLAAAVIEQRKAASFDIEDKSGTQGALHWTSHEAVLREDPKGFFRLVRISVDVRDTHDRLLLSVSTRKIRAVPAA